MKKLILSLIALCCACVINAQIVKIQPKLEVGKEKYFLGSIKENFGNTNYTAFLLQRIKVLSTDKDGFTMETELVKSSMDNSSSYEAELMETILLTRKNNVFKFKTNTDGVIISLLNADEVMKKGKDNLDEEWEIRFWAKYPEKFTNLTTQMALNNIVFVGLTEEGFLGWTSGPTFPFHLNGEEFESKKSYHYNGDSGLKMLRTIEFLSFDDNHNLEFEIKDKLDMSKEERKQILFNQLRKEFPDQTVEKYVDELFKASGLENYQKNLSFNYVLDSNFWPIKYEIIDEDDEHSTKYNYFMISDEKARELLGK